MSVVTLQVADVPVRPWNNGGGTTRELVSWPVGASSFDWRVSVASIVEDGPFSVLPDIERTITLIEGEGFRLCGAGVDQRLDVLSEPFSFDGALPLDCLLIDGRSTALNVMTRRGRGRSAVEISTVACTTPSATCGLLLSLVGDWQADDRQLPAGSALWWADQPRRWQLAPTGPSASIVVITWQPS